MSIPTLCAALLAATLPCALPAEPIAPARGEVRVTWDAPTRYVKGVAFPVKVRIEAPADGAGIADWLLSPGAFLIDGRPLAQRKGGSIVDLAPGTVLTLELDLGRVIESSQAFTKRDFELGFAREYLDTAPIAVRVYERSSSEIDFLAIPVAELAGYQVLMETNQGTMLLELYPDKAPRHVRNFLDLCQSGFYVGTLFHRVSPTFMVQGGCPNTKAADWQRWGQGSGPRMLEAEFNDRKHERGILSMARADDPNSASCQFFIMTARAPALDGKYSVFGRLVSGEQTLDRIASAKGVAGRDGTIRPAEPQKILATTIVRASTPAAER